MQENTVFFIVEMMACLSGWLFNTLSAAEVRLVLPLKPVVRESQGSLALPAGRVLTERNMCAINLLEIQFSIRGILQ